MSTSREDQPFARPDPQPAQQQYPPAQPYWQPSPPAPKQNNGLAIAAIVVASLTLLMFLGLIVFQALFGAILGGFMSSAGGFSPPDGGLKGTAPQVVAGQTYPGEMLQDEVARVVRGSGGDVTSISCPATRAVVPGAVAECQGSVDGFSWSFRVTFEDGSGHFTLDEKMS
jgi:hypothetical protein